MVQLVDMYKGKAASSQKFPARLNLTDFNITAAVTLQPSSYQRLGYLTVAKQQIVAFGSNTAKAGGVEGEPVYVDLRTNTGTVDTKVEGKVRFSIYDNNDQLLGVVMEERTERLRSDANDRNKARLLPLDFRGAPEDVKLVIEVYLDSASSKVIDYNATSFSVLVPITRIFK